jgi:hypothetical protein
MGYHRDRFTDMMHAGAMANPILPLLGSDAVTCAPNRDGLSSRRASCGAIRTELE